MTTAWPTSNIANVYEFAVGHNVSAVARLDEANQCRTVRTAWVPRPRLSAVEPEKLPGITLGMENLATLASSQAAHAALIGLADQYEAWIVAQHALAADLHHPHASKPVQTLLANARVAANRIRQGIDALSEPKVFRAFTLANAAMARQARRRDGAERASVPSKWMSRPGGRSSSRSSC